MLPYLFVFYAILSTVTFFKYILKSESITAAAAEGSQDAEMTDEPAVGRREVRQPFLRSSHTPPRVHRGDHVGSDGRHARLPGWCDGPVPKARDDGGAVVIFIYHVSPSSPAAPRLGRPRP